MKENTTQNLLADTIGDIFCNSNREECNVTEKPSSVDILDLFGPTHPHFYLIHYTALICLFISTVLSVYIFVYLLKHEGCKVFKWKIGQRLLLYLDFADAVTNVFHFIDHLYSVLQIRKGFEDFCVLSAFLLQTFSSTQSVLVMITSLSSFLCIAFNRQINYGKYDCVILLASFGIPGTIGAILVGLDWLGPAGFWCHGDLRKETGPIAFTITSSFHFATFIVNIISYSGIGLVIMFNRRRVNRFGEKGNADNLQKYMKTIGILILFVIAYMAQWWPLIAFSLWSYFGVPHIGLVEVVVIFANLGGVFNYIVHVFIRRRTGEQKYSSQRVISSNTNVSVVQVE